MNRPSRLSLSPVVLAFLGTLTSVAVATPNVPEAFLRAQINPPRYAMGPLMVSFNMDRARCEELYKANAEKVCERHLGTPGQPVLGLGLSPAQNGHWVWGNDNTVAFYPHEPWAPSQKLTLNFEGLTLPSFTKLAQKSVQLSTLPLSAEATTTFFPSTDPAAIGSVALRLSFLTKIQSRQAIEKAIRLVLPKDPAWSVGKPTFLWEKEAGHDIGLTVQYPILTAGKNKTGIHFEIMGLAASPDRPQQALPGKTVGLDVVSELPGTADLYQIQRARLERTEDDQLAIDYTLTVSPSLATQPKALLEAIELYELPEKVSPKAIEKADWTKAPVITPEILQASRRLTPTLASRPSALITDIPLSFKATQGRYVLARLKAGFGPSDARTLSHDWAQVFIVPKATSRLDFLEPGSMMTVSGKRTLTLHAAGVKKLKWTLSRIRDPFLAITASGQNDNVETASLSSALSGELLATQTESLDGRFVAVKLDELVKTGLKPGLYELSVEGERTLGVDPQATPQTIRASKRLLVSDVGLIAKTELNGTPRVYALNIPTGQPAGDLLIDLISANGTVLETQTSNAQGQVAFKSVAGLSPEKRPVAIIARVPPVHPLGAKLPAADNTQSFDASDLVAWLPIDSWQARDQFWSYDVHGRQVDNQALTGLLFTDRALYRPGESVEFGALIKRLGWQALTEGLPLQLEATNAMGAIAWRETLQTDKEGFAQTRWSLPQDALPGIYRFVLRAGDEILGETLVRVQRFEPESMMLTATPTLAPQDGWVAPDVASITTKLTFGFGSPAAKRQIRGDITVSQPDAIHFKGWEAFSFRSPDDMRDDGPYSHERNNYTSPERLTLTPEMTNDQGVANLTLSLAASQPGLRQVNVTLEGTDALGARATSTQTQLLVSSAKALAGYRVVDAADPLNAWMQHRALNLELAVINPQRQGLAQTPITLDVAKRHYMTELTQNDRGYLTYRDTPVLETVETQQLTTNEKGIASVTLKTDNPGEYTLQVKSATGDVLATIPYFVQGTSIKPHQSLPTAHMKLALGKTAYNAGETMTLNVLSPFDGTALLTLEANGVIASQWAQVKVGQNALTFPVPESADGKCWVTASLVRSPQWANRYLKAYSSATAPVMINRERHTLALTLTAPETQSDAKALRFSLKANAPAKAFVWAVDDGILRPTQYQLPRPLEAMMGTRGLTTTTYETLKDLMPEGLTLPGITPEGGDGENAKLAAALQQVMTNPFRRQLGASAVKWVGLVDVGPEAKDFTVALPETFQGAVRVMALGANATQLGAGSTLTHVRSPLTVNPQWPTFAAPGDCFESALNLVAQNPSTATLDVQTTGPVSLAPTPKEVKITTDGSTFVPMVTTAGQLPGAAQLTTQLQAGDLLASANATLSVRPAMLKQTYTTWGQWKQGTKDDAFTLNVAPTLLPFDAKTELTLSSNPVPLMRNLITVLNNSTHPSATVTEAIASAYPWVWMTQYPAWREALGYSAETVSERLKATVPSAVRVIREALRWNGLVDNNSRLDWEQNALALDFLLSVLDQGIPSDAQQVTKTLIATLKEQLYNATLASPDEAQDFAWTLVELTRAGILTTEPLEWLRQRLGQTDWPWQAHPTGLFLAQAYRLMHMTREAATFERNTPQAPVQQTMDNFMRGYYTAGAMLGLSDLSSTIATDLLSSSNGLTKPMALAALRGLFAAAPIKGTTDLSAITLACERWAPGFTANDATPTTSAVAKTLSAPGCTSFKVTGLKGLSTPLFWSTLSQGYPNALPKTDSAQGVRLRKTLTRDGVPVNGALHLGDVVTVNLVLDRYQGAETTENLVVTDLLPAGFELMTSDDASTGGARPIVDEDRVAFVINAPRGETLLSYQLRAVYPGDFTLPVAQAQSTRDEAIRGYSAAGKLTIEKR